MGALRILGILLTWRSLCGDVGVGRKRRKSREGGWGLRGGVGKDRHEIFKCPVYGVDSIYLLIEKRKHTDRRVISRNPLRRL